MLKDAMAMQYIAEQTEQCFFVRLDELTWGFEYNETYELKNNLFFRLGSAGQAISWVRPLSTWYRKSQPSVSIFR